MITILWKQNLDLKQLIFEDFSNVLRNINNQRFRMTI